MQHRLLVLLVILLTSSAVCAYAAESDSIRLGNCTGKGVSVAPGTVEGGALYYPASSMKLYAENCLTDVYVYTLYPTMVESFELFVSDSLDGAPLYAQEASLSKVGWNRIELTEPFLLDGNALYLGIRQEGAPLLYAARNTEGTEYVYEDGEWSVYDDVYSLALYGVVKGEHLPRYNVSWSCRKPVEYVRAGEPLGIDGTVLNKGVENIHTLTFRYTWDGNEQLETITELDIDYQSDEKLVLNGPVFPDAGDYTLQIELAAINGQGDLDPTDNFSDIYPLVCLDEFVPRNLLLEVFSTESCTNCPAGHKVIASAVEGNSRVIEVGHHAAFGVDKFTIDASLEYEWFHNGRLYTPSLLLDRTGYFDRYPEAYPYGEIAPVCGVADSFSDMLSEALDVPAFVALDVEASSGSESDYRNVSLTVSGETVLPDRVSGQARLTVLLTEDSVFSDTQRGASGGYYHRHVARQCLTDVWGDAVDLEEGIYRKYDVRIPDEWDMAKVRAVAFVSAYDPEDPYACRVYNSAAVGLRELVPVGLCRPVEQPVLRLDGRNLVLPDQVESVSVFTQQGVRIVTATAPEGIVSLGEYPAGVYLYQVFSEGMAYSGKIVLY